MKTTWLPGSLFLLTSGLLGAGTFPPPFNTERDTQAGPPPAGEAVQRLQLPPGFKATVFAAEPDVQNPIALAWDGRGRLWVAENYTYAERGPKFELRLRDRVLIFEDRDGDGRFDARTVFTDDVQMLTSVEVGWGGVWLMCPPRLLFIPDRDGDDRPDGPPEVVLDGFTVPADNYHNFANGLRFGPDGWLYGRCGASSPGELGVPGTPAADRVPMRGTLWRYHPTRRVVEVLSGGCTNPWGHDWNEHGELFFINTVNGQLWHDITGAHYVRPHTIDHNPWAYALIDQHADHWHFDTGEGWSKSRTNGSADSLGGGHAHVGMMIYQGDNWPEVYRGRLFTLNLHGRRANQEILERQGSGYVGHHGEDMIVSGDPWFRGMELTTGPDGGVFVADWSDTGECHESSGVHRTSGRIYKVTYGEPKRPATVDLRKLSPAELVGLHHHANEWFARQARGELARRAAARADLAPARNELQAQVEQETNVVWKLRALWTLHVLGGAGEALLRAQLRDQNEHVRAWSIRLFTEDWPLDTVFSQRPPRAARSPSAVSSGLLAELVRLGKSDPSGLVRLVLASTLQRLPPQRRLELAGELVAHAEDAQDHNLPLMIWYGLIPVADTDPSGLARLTAKCELPATRQYIARRLAEDNQTSPGPLTTLLGLARSKPEAFQLDVLTGLAEAWKGMRKVPAPTGWEDWQTTLAKAADPRLRDRARELGALFGDGRALEDVKRLALDREAELAARKAALRTLIDSRPPDLRPICESLLGVTFLNVVAVRGLALFDDPILGEKLTRSYRSFHQTERGVLLEVLVSRPAFARALLADIAAGKIPRADLTAYHARQIRSHDDPALTRQLAEAWGEWREAAADKRELIARLKRRLTPTTLAGADPARGRVVFQTACASCHRLHGEGGQVGPDLTGSGRDNLDYLLENIVDPSAAVSADFRMSVAGLKDGRVLNGIVSSTTPRTLSLKTMTDTITVERSEVESLTESKLSLMPEGLLEALSETQVGDLIAYLMHAEQVPLPATAEASASAGGR